MSKHTPGPWIVGDRLAYNIPIRHLRTRKNPQHMTVCYVGTVGNHADEQTTADAHLIAAAPLLLTVCESVANQLASLKNQELKPLVNRLRRAVAAAKKGQLAKRS
jgi:hypothetical protein